MVYNYFRKCLKVNEFLGIVAAHSKIAGFTSCVYSARINLVVGEVEIDGNHLLEFRGFESLPVKLSQQPEPSLACACGNA